MTDTLTQRVAEAIGKTLFETHGFASSQPFTEAAQAAIEASGVRELEKENAELKARLEELRPYHKPQILAQIENAFAEGADTVKIELYSGQKDDAASGAKHLQGFNLLSEKQPNIGEYCLCICDSDDHGGVYFCTSHYHGKTIDNRYGTSSNTCGFYCHSVVAWMGGSQMRNMAKELLAALQPELRDEE